MRAVRGVIAAAVVLAAVAVVLTGWGPGTAAAFWTADTVRPGSSTARLGVVPQAATPQPQVNGRAVTLAWTPVTLADGRAVDGYTVQRQAPDGTAQTVGAGCSGRIGATSCTETQTPEGVWTYTVTAVLAGWSGPVSGRSASVRVDVTPPTLAISQESVSGRSLQRGDTVYYRGVVAGSFRLISTVTDTGSGPASASTGALTGGQAGWSHTPTNVATPDGGPYRTAPFSWSAGTTSSPVTTVEAFDRSGNRTARELRLLDDSTAPTGGQLSHSTGALTASTLTVGLAAVTDAGVGVDSRVLQEGVAPLSGSTCGTPTWTSIATNPGSSVTRSVQNGSCYQYRYVLTDALGNQTTVAGPGTARIRSYQATVQGTPGLVGFWRLDDTSGTQIAATTGSPGTYGGGPTLRQEGAVSGDPSTSVLFDGQDDFGRISRPISTSFSIEFWFRSTQGLTTNTSGQWWGAAGLVDAEVGGVQNDFGVSLAADGSVRAGTGNPDRTVTSGAGYNDGRWHHVVFTRNAGTLQLYVDGELRASRADGNTSALTAPANIDFGRLQTGINYYRGNLDEIALYTAVLPADTVRAHYQAGQP